MSMKAYQSKYVVCPFYHQEKWSQIQCEGFCKTCSLQITFASKAELQFHKEIHCESFVGYPKCPIFPVINKQYEGVEKH